MSKNYEPWSDDAAATEAATDRQESIEIMKLSEGKNTVRFLPPQVGATAPWVIVHQHYVKNPHVPDAQLIVFPCPTKMYSLPCPICSEANRLSRTGNKQDREEAFKLWPKMRVFAEVVCMEAVESSVQILAFGKMIYNQLRNIRNDSDSGGDFTHPETGFDIIIHREGTGLSTKYDVRPSRHETVLQNMNWLDDRNDLDRFKAAAPNHVMESAALALGISAFKALPEAHSDVIDAETVPPATAMDDFNRG
jgi:hypothetical protein